jgi:ATPase subunit of ABC transporter with duplicated ATPase domains
MIPGGTVLRVTDLTAGYRRAVVGPLSFDLALGEVLGVWGPNGCGKSTLLAAIAESARLFAGRVERAPGLGLAWQEQRPARPPTLPLTGWDLLRVAGAAGVEAPEALRPWLERRIDRLSGGQYQLLCLWAALGGGAGLVLLDEPTNNLDPAHEALLADLLAQGQGRRALMLVSHERAFLDSVCTRVLELS